MSFFASIRSSPVAILIDGVLNLTAIPHGFIRSAQEAKDERAVKKPEYFCVLCGKSMGIRSKTEESRYKCHFYHRQGTLCPLIESNEKFRDQIDLYVRSERSHEVVVTALKKYLECTKPLLLPAVFQDARVGPQLLVMPKREVMVATVECEKGLPTTKGLLRPDMYVTLTTGYYFTVEIIITHDLEPETIEKYVELKLDCIQLKLSPEEVGYLDLWKHSVWRLHPEMRVGTASIMAKLGPEIQRNILDFYRAYEIPKVNITDEYTELSFSSYKWPDNIQRDSWKLEIPHAPLRNQQETGNVLLPTSVRPTLVYDLILPARPSAVALYSTGTAKIAGKSQFSPQISFNDCTKIVWQQRGDLYVGYGVGKVGDVEVVCKFTTGYVDGAHYDVVTNCWVNVPELALDAQLTKTHFVKVRLNREVFLDSYELKVETGVDLVKGELVYIVAGHTRNSTIAGYLEICTELEVDLGVDAFGAVEYVPKDWCITCCGITEHVRCNLEMAHEVFEARQRLKTRIGSYKRLTYYCKDAIISEQHSLQYDEIKNILYLDSKDITGSTRRYTLSEIECDFETSEIHVTLDIPLHEKIRVCHGHLHLLGVGTRIMTVADLLLGSRFYEGLFRAIIEPLPGDTFRLPNYSNPSFSLDFDGLEFRFGCVKIRCFSSDYYGPALGLKFNMSLGSFEFTNHGLTTSRRSEENWYVLPEDPKEWSSWNALTAVVDPRSLDTRQALHGEVYIGDIWFKADGLRAVDLNCDLLLKRSLRLENYKVELQQFYSRDMLNLENLWANVKDMPTSFEFLLRYRYRIRRVFLLAGGKVGNIEVERIRPDKQEARIDRIKDCLVKNKYALKRCSANFDIEGDVITYYSERLDFRSFIRKHVAESSDVDGIAALLEDQQFTRHDTDVLLRHTDADLKKAGTLDEAVNQLSDEGLHLLKTMMPSLPYLPNTSL